MATSLFAGRAAFSSVHLATAKADLKPQKTRRYCGSSIAGLGMKSLSFDQERPATRSSTTRFASLVCAAALNARCAEGQTQTVQRQQTNITVAPLDSKEKSPDLDDGGAGFPPRDDDDGGGGGGGGDGWKGGFFFFGFLAFLGFLKDNEGEGTRTRKGRRRLSKI